jgi:hypothetical protein
MPPRGPKISEGQTQLSNEDMGISVPVSATEDTTPIEAMPSEPEALEAEGVEAETEEMDLPKYEDSESSFRLAKDSVFLDPFPKHKEQPEQISLVGLLEREFEGSWHKLVTDPNGRDKVEGITHIIMSRFGNPESVRSFAEGFKKYYSEEIQDQIDALHDKFDDLDKRFDRAADYERSKNSEDIQELTRQLYYRKITGNEIFAYLNQLAEDWERKLSREPRPS